MAILKTLKRAFGFGSDPDEEFSDYPSDDMIPEPNRAPEQLHIQNQDHGKAVDMIFATAVEIFNKSLPEFLSQSIDGEKQRQLLYQALDKDVKEYIARAEADARQKGEGAWQAEREKLLAEAEELRKKAEGLEQKKSLIKEKQLSADRQKRALADRVRDLEAQVMTLEAEKEQLDLEAKSMLNKAKAASVLDKEMQEKDDRYAELESKAQEKDERIAELESKAQEKDGRIAELEGKAQEKDGRIADLEDKAQEKDDRIAELENKVQELEARCEDTADKAEIEEIQKQLDTFEDVKKKMDAHIAKLKASLAAAQAENEALRESIKENMTRNNQQQKKMQEKIDALELQAQEAPAATAAPEPAEKAAKPNKKAPKKKYQSEVDELISGADWLVSVPKEESPMRLVQESEEFGYNAPARKAKPMENEAQLSLFDF